MVATVLQVAAPVSATVTSGLLCAGTAPSGRGAACLPSRTA